MRSADAVTTTGGTAGAAAARPASAPVVLAHLAGVTVRYGGVEARPALDGVDLEVRAGDRMGLFGPNGGGKTTLVKAMLGLVRPQRGTVELMGLPVRWGRHYPDVGYIGNPSRTEGDSGLPPDLTVETLLGAQRALYLGAGLAYPEGEALAKRLDLHLPSWRSKRVGELSDGWRQRVMFLLALAKRPRLLVADEAMAALDLEHRWPLLDAVREMADRTGMAVVWVTHAPLEIDRLRLRTLCVNDGRLTAAEVATTTWSCTVETNGDGSGPACDMATWAVHDVLSDLAADPRTTRIALQLKRRKAGGGGDR